MLFTTIFVYQYNQQPNLAELDPRYLLKMTQSCDSYRRTCGFGQPPSPAPRGHRTDHQLGIVGSEKSPGLGLEVGYQVAATTASDHPL